MFLQTSLTTRRKFLERSMLGFGSAFVLPSLLASCTDHVIPPINPPINPPIITPPLHDDNIDWNDDAKTLITTALSLAIPEGGEILAAMVEIFWPSSGSDTWSQVKAQVEALVNQKIDTLVYGQVSDDLTGLKNVLDNYDLALHPTDVNGNPAPVDYERVRTYWRAADDFLGDALPHFQSAGYEVLLLPLFAQFANIYLATYRDAVAFGASWGFLDSEVANAAKKLTDGISDFTTYTNNTYTTGIDNLSKTTPPDYEQNEPFKTTNTFARQMTLWALDFMDTWPYFDISKYPSGATVEFTREIYSDPFGDTYVYSGVPQPINLPPPATQRPTQLTVWGGSRIDAVQLTYPPAGGPGGVTQTPRMGDQNGGTNQPPAGGVFPVLLDNPIIQAQVSYDYVRAADRVQAIYTMFFMYNDGTTTHTMGKDMGQFKSGVVGYNYQALSSIYIQGFAYGLQDSANCIIFGFLYWSPPGATLRALGNIYITSPKERSVADFAKAYPKLGLSANSITDGLKAARKAYWEAVKTRAK